MASSPTTATRGAFSIDIPQERLDDLLARVRAARWPAQPSGGGWRYGPDHTVMQAVCERLLGGYDWRAHERQLNGFAHELVTVGPQTFHVMRAGRRGARPLLLLHGWPYSFSSFLEILGPLADPAGAGGTTDEAFEVLVPSLPGYGFSPAPATPIGPRHVARLLDELMDELGYERYLVAGGDWGAQLASLMAFQRPERIAGIHLTHVELRHAGAGLASGRTGARDSDPDEEAFVAGELAAWEREGAYYLQQMTRPQALAYAMADSPVGAAAWLVDKWHAWADLRERDFLEVFGLDRLLSEILVYELTGSFTTAMWLYAGQGDDPAGELPPGARIEVPVGVAAFPDPVFPAPPRRFVERSHDVVRYVEMPRGGHFPFLEAPDDYVRELRAFAGEVAA